MHPQGWGKLNVHIAQLWAHVRLCARRKWVKLRSPGGGPGSRICLRERTFPASGRFAPEAALRSFEIQLPLYARKQAQLRNWGMSERANNGRDQTTKLQEPTYRK